MSTSEPTAGAQRGPLPPWQRVLSWILLVMIIGMVVDGLVIGQLESRLAGLRQDLQAEQLLALCRNLLYTVLGLASLAGYILLTIRRRSDVPSKRRSDSS